jgi:hypothetical protein
MPQYLTDFLNQLILYISQNIIPIMIGVSSAVIVALITLWAVNFIYYKIQYISMARKYGFKSVKEMNDYIYRRD